jgi:hypothetical protein
MAEDVNVEEEEFEEEEEEQSGAEAQQTLDDLTVLNDSTAPIDDPEAQTAGDDTLEWEEPAASQSLATIHTGSRPTDAEIMANLVPEGESIIGSEEIDVIEEDPEAVLPDVAPPAVEPEVDRRPEPQQAREPQPEPQQEAPPEEEPAPPPVAEEPAPEPEPAPAAEEAAPPPPAAEAVVQEPPVVDPPEEEEEEVTDGISVEDATGDEDSAIALDIDAGDAAQVTISGVPDGAVLSAGTDNGDGSWTLSAGELTGLTITPPADSDVDFTLSVEGDGAAYDLDVVVNAVADAPTATAEDASGLEDTAIDLDLGSALTDIDGSESLSVTISGMPDGAVLSAGTDNGDGTWSLTTEDFAGLTITPPQDFTGEIDLTLTAVSTEADGGDTAVTEVPFTVTVADVAETTDATTAEDTAVALDITYPEGATSGTISDIPDGAVLMSGGEVITITDGSAEVTADQLADLTITPPADSDADFTLSVSSGGTTADLDVTVTAVADAPTATAEDASGLEDTAIDLDLGSALSDIDGSESLSIVVSGVPDGAVLSSGTDNGDGTWTLTTDDFDGLTITPPQDFTGDIDMTLTATSTEADGGDTAVTEVPFTVTVTDVAEVTDAATVEDTAVALDITYPEGTTTGTISDIPDGAVLMSGGEVITITDGSAEVTADQLADLTITPPADSGDDFVLQVEAAGVTQDLAVTVQVDADGADVEATDASGNQGMDIPLELDAQLTADTDGSEAITSVVIDISEAPEGTTLSAGTDNGDGTWTVAQADLANLSVTPPADFVGDFDATMTVTSVDTGDTPSDTDTATDSISFNVSVSAEGTFSVTNSVGDEDTAIPLTIDPGTATSVVISDVPAGAELSAGTDNGDGTWSLSLTDLDGLTITPPADSDVDFTLQVTAGGETVPLGVRVDAVADAPSATAEDAVGEEGQAVPLDLGSALTDTDGSESLSVTIDMSDAPAGTTFSAGTDNGDGTWSVDVADLAGLSVTAPAGFFGDMDFTLVATSTEADGGDSATTEVPFTVTLTSDGDFGVTTASGIEDNAIALTIDDGGAEVITISDVPEGATLSAGTDNGDGSWTLTAADLDGLTITPPADDDTDFTLQVTADGETLPLDVTVGVDADAPTASASDVSGTEDTSIPLDGLSAGLTDLDGSESLSVTISGMPSGSSLSAGTDNGDGTWTVDAGDLATLSFTPPTGFDGDIPLTLVATSTDTDTETGATDTETTTVPFTITVRDDGQDVVFDVTEAQGLEDNAIALEIDPGTATVVTIGDVPEGAVLSAGTDNGDGTWTLAVEDLEDLTITPPQDSDVDFTLQVTADGETLPLDVTVLAVADRPDLEVHSTVGNEDTSIPLSIGSQLTDTDGSETLSMTVDITGIPDGAVLTRNGVELDLTYDPDTDSYTVELNPDELTGLAITPPQDFYGDINLQVTSTSTESDPNAAVSSASTTSSFGVTVRPVEDNPIISSNSASGLEDGADIPLDVTVGMAEGVTETVATVIVGGVPEGAQLSAGTDNGDGTWSLSAEDLNGLTINPADNWFGTSTMTVTAISTDGGISVGQFTLDVADTADLTATDASGLEDAPIALDIDAGTAETVTIADIPDGAVLMSGGEEITITDGSAEVTADQLADLTISPPADSDADFTLSVSAGGVTAELDVDVTGVADAPSLDLGTGIGTGDEDTAIALDITSGLTDTDGSESLSVTISGVPSGATLSAGTDNGDGTWTLDAGDLDGLSITPPLDFNGSFDLTVTSTATEADGDTATTSGTLTVDVAAVDDEVAGSTLDVTDAAGTEDTGIGLSIDVTQLDTDGSESVSVTISGVPADASLSAGTDNGDGTWTLTAEQLDNLTITPPADSSDDFTLGVSVTTTETEGGASSTVTGSIAVDVTGDADTPTLTLGAGAGDEDTAIALDITSGLTDTDGSETLSVSISDIPDGAVLMSGGQAITVTDGVAEIDPAQLADLTIIPPADFSGSFDLTVTSTATEADGDTATSSGTLTVDVAGVADAADLSVADASGLEDGAIALNIDAGTTDDSESLSVTISGVPSGAVLSAGTDNGDGTWTLSSNDLNGLTITPPADSDTDFTLGVTATTTDGTDTETVSGSIDVDVTGVADTPTLDLTAASGDEDNAIGLDITSAVTDTDGSETLSVSISDIPDGAVLMSGGQAITVTDGVAEIDPAQLADLTIIPPADFSGSFDLTVTSTATEASGDTATSSGTLTVDVAGVADAPTLETSDTSGLEDGAIALNIDAGTTDDSESLSVTISGVPSGATLSAGTDNGDGTWTLSSNDLNGLTITPPADSDNDFTLGVTATSTDGTDTEVATGSIAVDVTGVADTPTLDLTAASGSEDNAIGLDITSAVTDTDGSETLSVTISDIPDGAVLMSGGQAITVTDGVAEVDPGQLAGLTITPPLDFNGSFDLTVTSTATEASGDTATNTGTLSVNVGAIDDEVAGSTLDVADAAGTEDSAIGLSIDVTQLDTDGSESVSVTVSGVPAGATLSAGTDNGDGTWTLGADDLDGLTVTPPEDSNVDFTLGVSVTTTETEGGATNTVTGSIAVDVTGDADTPTLVMSGATGSEDSAIPLDISPALTDTDGSETLSVSISNIPDGAVLASNGAVIDVTDGTAELTPAQLSGLTITPPPNSAADFSLAVTATATEDDGDSASVTGVLNVAVGEDADAPTLVLNDASGTEDMAVDLDITAALTDSSEVLSVIISDIPDGSTIFASAEDGTPIQIPVVNGSATIPNGVLDNITLVPPADSDEDFTLSVTALSTDVGESSVATTTGTLQVSLAADADTATLVLDDSAGIEDTAIGLDISSTLTDTDGSETLSVTLSDIPDGAVLMSGGQEITVTDGVAEIDPAQLADLSITPPADYSGSFDLTVTSTATEADGDTATTSGTLTVDVAGVADAADLDVSDASGLEDNAIALNIDAGVTDDSESLSITISDIPDGAVLMSDGQAIDITDGSATLTADQLENLTITPPEDSDGDFTLNVSATTTDGTDTETVTGSIDVDVTGVADAPTLDLSAAAGDEDTSIALDISSGLTDTDGSETLSVTISDIPDGAVLMSGGQEITVTDGVAEIDPAQLADLSITPPADYSGSFDLTVTSTATEADGDTATTSGTLTVDVAAVDDEVAGSTLDVSDAAGTEDTAIGLNIDVTQLDTDGSESVSITVSGVPAGASLSAGTDNGDGTWTLDAGDLDGLTITPPEDSNADFTLGVSVTTTEANGGDTTTTSASIDVDVTGVSDGAELSVSLGDETATVEEVVYDLDLSATLSDTDGSESVSVTISDMPAGVTLSAGTDNGDGTWTLDAGDLDGLEMTVPDGTPAFDLSVAATATEDDGDSYTTTATISVDATDTSASEADVAATDASGLEDNAIALDIDVTAVDADGSETMSITISDVPTGALLSAGTDNGDGTWTLDAGDLDGLTITPPDDSNADFTLGVSVTTTETSTGDTTTATTTLDVDVAGVADAPTLSVSIGEGEVTTIGGEPVDVTIGSDNVTETGGGFTVTARSVDENGELTEASSDSISTNSNPPGFGVSGDASGAGTELGYDGNDGPSEQLIVSFDEDVSSVDVSFAWLSPTESAHYEFYQDGVKVGEGTIDGGSDGVDAAISLSPDGGVSFDQIVFSAPGNGDDFLIHSIDFEATEGGETSVTYPLDITSGLTDTDGSETLSITVSDLPDGATLSAGTDNGDGSWTLSAEDLDGLEITVTGDDPGQSFDLSVTATATEDDGDTATISVTASTDGVEVDSSADGASIDASDASGLEDTAIALNIDVTQVDTDGSETMSITISDVPTGATLSAGTDNGDGTWTLDAGDLDGLTVTPADDSSADFTLGVSVTTTETSSGDTSTTSASLDVSVTGDADTPTLTINAASGDEDASIDLDITSALTDTDGSETLSVIISDIPDGAVLMSGGQEITVTDGVAEIDPGQLADLSITPPADYNGSFDLTVTSTATEADGDTATTSGTLTVDVAAVDDEVAGSTLDVTDAAGNEDTAIALNIDVTQLDTDGSESVSITVSDVPSGATLSAGTDNGDGTWTLNAGDLDGLTITPPEDSNADFTLGVSVTTTEAEGGATSTTSTTLDVDVTGVADAPTLSVTVENTGQTLGETDIDVPQDILDAATGDNVVTISGIPEGAELSAGTDNGDGTWTLNAGDLDGLAVTPAEGSTDTISMSFEVTGTTGAGDTLSSDDFSGGVSGWSGDATASGGQMILQGDASTSKTFDFGSEHAGQTVTISFDYDANVEWEESGSYTDYFDVSANGESVLSTTENSASSASFTVTLDENGQVVLDMSTNTTASNEFMAIDNLQISAGDDWESTLASADLDVEPDVAGNIYDVDLLDITSGLTDTDGSETLSITVDGLPEGATLTAGTENPDGSWTLDSGDLDGLEMLVPAGSGDFNLTVSATATENDGDTNTVTTTVTVEEPDLTAEGATIDATDATGLEDSAIALNIDVTQIDTDGSESMAITISDVPTGATLSAGTDNGDGTWTLDAGDLDGLTITPADDSNADFTLGVSVTTTESSSGETATMTSSLDVDVTGVADAPTLSASTTFSETSAGETAIDVPQDILDVATGDNTVTVSGVPDGAALSAGTDNGDGTWTLDAGDVDGLTFTPADGSTDTVTLSYEVNGAGGAGDTLESDDFSSVSGWGSEVSVVNNQMAIGHDESASKTFDFGAEHAGQTVTITFDTDAFGSWDESGSYADYFQVSANGEQLLNTVEGDATSYSLTATLDENGQLQLDFANNTTASDEGMYVDNLVIAAGDDWESTLATATGDVEPEPAGLVFDLDITSGLTDTDGSETLSITVADLPAGAELSAGTDNGDGTWTLSAGDLDGLQMTVPADAGNFDLAISATATENDGDTNTVSVTTSVSPPDLVAEDPTLTTSAASGEEDRAIALSIDAGLTDTDGSETLSITISDVPDGALLSAGTDNGDGTWTLSADDLDGLTITPSENSDADFTLGVSATTTESSSGDTSTVTSSVSVSVDAVADAPELTVDLGSATEVGGGASPVSYWKLDEDWGGSTLTDSVGDNDGTPVNTLKTNNETGVFDGAAEFSGGGKSYNEEYIEVDHSAELKPENGALTLWFNADDIGGRNCLASSDSSGNDDGGHFGLWVENGQIHLRMQGDNSEGETNIYGGSVSTDEWNQVTVTWGDSGAKIYLNGELVGSDDNWTRGLEGNEEPWTFGANQWSSSDGVANNMDDFFNGHMDDIAIYDQQLDADDVAALYDNGVEAEMQSGGDVSLQYPLNITANLTDTDGSESVAITIEGLPDDAILSAGTDNGDGTWTLDSADLDDLTVTVPEGSDDFLLSVSATATDTGGDTRTVTESVQVDVGSDGFDAGTTGTESADTMTGTSGDDVISGMGGNDDIDAGAGDDTVLGGAGDDTIDGGAGDDDVMGGAGDDLFIFGSGDGADYFHGGDGWSDTIQIDGVDGGPGADAGWAMQVDEGVGYTETENGIEFDAEASGVITLDDGSELTFDGVEKLEW